MPEEESAETEAVAVTVQESELSMNTIDYFFASVCGMNHGCTEQGNKIVL